MTPADPYDALGVRLGADGADVGLFSANASAVELCVFGDESNDPIATVPLERGRDGLWQAHAAQLAAGGRYAYRVSGPDGPRNAFRPDAFLLDPYARAVEETPSGMRCVAVADAFDWGESAKPATPLAATVVYEAHVKGISMLNPEVPEELRGTYAGLAHPATLNRLVDLGVTAIELLPVHAFATEPRLARLGRANYWGYNTLAFFAPHPGYATASARASGPAQVLREFKGMVKLAHEAGLEVLLDVVYNHTAEGSREGPTSSLRGIDNSTYYRQDSLGRYIDTTGCGNTVDFGQWPARRLVRDSLRYWSRQVGIDGFRFDLAATLGRDDRGVFTPDHPLLYGLVDDPQLAGVKLIAEPWDVGDGGWQTGNFPAGFSEWNDRYRDELRTFWLRDIADARSNGSAPTGIGTFASRLAGSAQTFSPERGPLASLNYVTAHDGFTLADVVAFDRKHNEDNGEDGLDGNDNPHSFNHGVEGPTDDPEILATRRRAARNLIGTLLLSAGVPMITAGDEFGRTQRGNNNAYCHDDPLTWLDYGWDPWQRDLVDTVRTLIRFRRDNAALRPRRYGRFGETVPKATQMDWYDASGSTMSIDDWQSPGNRTLQYLAASTPEFEPSNRILLVVHGLESDTEVVLPRHEGVRSYSLLWDSALERPREDGEHAPGQRVPMTATSMKLFRAHG